ncbi:hypothetical protein [Micromonospora echinofusca]|uniref:hypothetical protein n=1 Tax=Micromonospora echinofusca TaxID=47858 RepID=UPI0027DDCEBC|nr:hypothetical protein [Micromonospora echinofusca]
MKEFDVDPHQLVIVTFDLRKLLGYVDAVVIRHFDIAALDHDIHVTSLDRTVVGFWLPAARPQGIPVVGGQVCAATPPSRRREDGGPPFTPVSKTLTLLWRTVTCRGRNSMRNFRRSPTIG